jgi:hypothetical protein
MNKTGKPHPVPIAKVLQHYLLTLSASDDPDTPIFPRAAALASQTRSNQFAGILAAAGLQKARTHAKTEGGEMTGIESNLSRGVMRCPALSG